MSKLLKFTLSGVKNIEEPITIDFCNQSIEKLGDAINITKGIFGYNGAGKTALMTGVNLYRMVATSSSYLIQNQTQEFLEQVLNPKSKRFEACFCFLTEQGRIMRHSICISKDRILCHYLIESESLALANGRTLNEKFEVAFSKSEKSSFAFGKRYKEEGSSFLKAPLSPYASLVSSYAETRAKEKDNLGLGSLLLDAFAFALQLDVYLQSEKLPCLSPLQERIRILQGRKILPSEIDPSEERVKIEDFASYEKANASLERFVRLFKPSLQAIRLSKTLDKDAYHIRKEFVYEDYALDFAYESSGIKQLVRLYHYLKECSDGQIVFIDEIDVNLNTAYFKKLIEYFLKYGKGQLIFTTHNVEAMDVLRKTKRGIEVIGSNGKVHTWVASGNRSPIKEYLDGYIPHSPLNIEDFDFITVFQSEEEEV